MNLDDLLTSLETSSGIEKKASTQEDTKPLVSQELAGILEKKATEDLTKSAFAQGEELARALLQKLANEIQTDNASMVSDDDKKIKSNETGGDIESVLQNTVNNAVASGATTDDRVNHETQVNNVETPNAVEKTAEKKTKEDTMNKSAQDNLSLAKQIMEKLAQEFDAQVTTPAAGVNTNAAMAPNKIQEDNAVMTAQDDAKVEGIVPGGDGTVNALFETIVAKAKAQGGQSDDLINGDASVASRSTQGVDGTPETATGTGGESVEKAAAVSALCEAGMDFDQAVSLVKAAEEELISESWEQEKRACLEQLMDAGVDFDSAIALIKEAEEDLLKKQ